MAGRKVKVCGGWCEEKQCEQKEKEKETKDNCLVGKGNLYVCVCSVVSVV